MSGTLYQYIIEKTADIPFVETYLAGGMAREEFIRTVEASAQQLAQAGLSGYHAQKLAMLPNVFHAPAEGLLRAMADSGLIPESGLDDDGYRRFAERVSRDFQHLPDRFTSIFPDETRGAYEFSRVTAPRNVVVAGSYYNYLSIWLAPGLASGGTITCCDVDCSVTRLGARNITAMGLDDQVTTVCRDAEAFLKEGEEPIDLLVLDAYGPSSHPDPHYHGKSIYGPLLRAALPRLVPDAYLLVHNADRDSPHLAEFYDLTRHARFQHFLGTTDDLAVFRI